MPYDEKKLRLLSEIAAVMPYEEQLRLLGEILGCDLLASRRQYGQKNPEPDQLRAGSRYEERGARHQQPDTIRPEVSSAGALHRRQRPRRRRVP